MKYTMKNIACYTGCLLFFLLSSFNTITSQDSRQTGNNYAFDVEYGKNVNYQGDNEKLLMDIYWPKTGKKQYPLVVLIHGGSFVGGDKKGFRPSLAQLADSGFVAVSINYRLGWNRPKVTDGCNADLSDLPNAVYRAFQDGHAALRFLVHHAAQYHIDPDWIFVGGASAGGIIALNLTYMDQKHADTEFAPQIKKFGKLNNASNDLKDVYKIKGVCNMWGGLSDSTMITASNAVPSILFHGTKDMVVPYDHGTWRSMCPDTFPVLYGSACIYRQLRTYHQPAILDLIINGKHGPVELSKENIMSNTACFFHRVIRGNAHSGSYTGVHTGCM
ncbi:alpha/beta hydrolase (plasmid) [Pedobacter sp. BS3]|uniref:alpha/beta hydrolase n=1 Tax=Pedobacter sp. BS3 TaxID=2567937 RepID=UPI0011F058FC|nr:alpha/beta hydrolase [Pedobacter sp. BS3]TZF86472.1 alpha/beta hydrolase [Pedobacter sp. BS3]